MLLSYPRDLIRRTVNRVILTLKSQIPLDFGYRSAAGSSDFLVAPCNKDAVAWVDRWPDWPSPALFIFGPVGSGKSHLGHIWCGRSGADRLQMEGLTVDTAADVEKQNSILIDPLKAPFDELALLHLYNTTAEKRGHLLIISEVPPARLAVRLADLRSRLQAAPTVGIGSPDDALVGAVMLKQFTDRQLSVDPEVLTFLMARMERTFEAASNLVAALDEAALIQKRRITVPLAREVLARQRA